MDRLKNSPLLFLVLLLLVSALACQAVSTNIPEGNSNGVNQQAVVDEVVATVVAQLPAQTTVTSSTSSTTQIAPLSTDIESGLIALYQRVNPSVVNIFVLDTQSLSLIHISEPTRPY